MAEVDSAATSLRGAGVLASAEGIMHELTVCFAGRGAVRTNPNADTSMSDKLSEIARSLSDQNSFVRAQLSRPSSVGIDVGGSSR